MCCEAHVSGTQAPASTRPHWLETPPPPHVSGGVHGPHWITLPQPSPAGPQPRFCCAQVSGTQAPASGYPHCPAIPPPPHTAGDAQGLQKAVTPPQPSACGPQVVDGNEAHESGLQAPASGKPHWLGVPPPPQVAGGVHGLQSAVAPPDGGQGAPVTFRR